MKLKIIEYVPYKPSNSLLYRQPEIRWRIPPVHKIFTLRPVSILVLGGGREGGKWLQDLGDHKIFRENGGGICCRQ